MGENDTQHVPCLADSGPHDSLPDCLGPAMRTGVHDTMHDSYDTTDLAIYQTSTEPASDDARHLP